MSILENELWEMDPGVSEILPALRLSYQRMPAHLKPCFRYCSMLPKNEKLNKNRLVRLWVAQGYIQAKTINNTVEETAKEYFDELLGRSFFQEDKYWRNSFEMHDLIFDLAVFISSNEFLKITMGGGKQNKLLSDNIRHLVIYHESTHNGMGQVPIVVWRSSSSLRNLLVENCHELSTLRGLCNLHFLERLKFNRCYNLLISAEERLPSKLQYVCFSDCRKLTSVTGLHDLHFLEKLELERCPKLQLSLDESFSIMASNVNVIDCPRLKEWYQKYGFEFKQKYQIHDLFHNFAEHVGVECSRIEVPTSSCKKEKGIVSHISLVPCAEEALQFSDLFAHEIDLRTILLIPRSASKWPGSAVHIEKSKVLDDLFIKFNNLRSLDLSNTDIKQLPDSIGSLKFLCYLSLSNTNIRRLPNSICSLSNLQTLELQDCSFLSDLPSNIKELTKLRCLNVFKESGFISMPSGIGELRNLRTLSNFNVGKVESHRGIVDLQNLLNLRGSLYIAGLENIVSGDQANRANLNMKGCLKSLTLHWFQDGWESDVETDQNALDVLQHLQPHTNLEELIIHGYFGDQFPTWLGDPMFCNLISLTLENCYESIVLPLLGQLPSLRFLSLQKMDSVRTLASEFCRT